MAHRVPFYQCCICGNSIVRLNLEHLFQGLSTLFRRQRFLIKYWFSRSWLEIMTLQSVLILRWRSNYVTDLSHLACEQVLFFWWRAKWSVREDVCVCWTFLSLAVTCTACTAQIIYAFWKADVPFLYMIYEWMNWWNMIRWMMNDKSLLLMYCILPLIVFIINKMYSLFKNYLSKAQWISIVDIIRLFNIIRIIQQYSLSLRRTSFSA